MGRDRSARRPLKLDIDAETGRISVHVRQIVRDLDGRALVDQFIRHVYAMEQASSGPWRSPRFLPGMVIDRPLLVTERCDAIGAGCTTTPSDTLR